MSVHARIHRSRFYAWGNTHASQNPNFRCVNFPNRRLPMTFAANPRFSRIIFVSANRYIYRENVMTNYQEQFTLWSYARPLKRIKWVKISCGFHSSITIGQCELPLVNVSLSYSCLASSRNCRYLKHRSRRDWILAEYWTLRTECAKPHLGNWPNVHLKDYTIFFTIIHSIQNSDISIQHCIEDNM